MSKSKKFSTPLIPPKSKQSGPKQSSPTPSASYHCSGVTVINLKDHNESLGGGENRVAIRQAVYERLKSDPRVAPVLRMCAAAGTDFDYGQREFAVNMDDVKASVADGSISMPRTPAEWVDALVTEYTANIASFAANVRGY